ncbi:MAG: FtsB/FtsL family cell division protein [Solirubrobacteraceae bacterium]
MSPPPLAAAAPAVRARTAAPKRPLTTVPRPRRVSGPVRPKAAPAPRRPESADQGLVLGAIGALGRVSSHRLVDRLIRGRTWIALVAFALIGIVTLQLGLLKLNAAIGRSLEHSALLQRENAALSIENSELAGGGRVEAAATHLGMQLVTPGTLRFLTARPHVDARHAIAALKEPLHAVAPEASSSSTTGESSESSSSESSSSESAPGESTSSTEQAASTEPTSTATSTPSATAGESSPTGGEAAAPSESAAPSEAPSPAAIQASPAGGTQAAAGG